MNERSFEKESLAILKGIEKAYEKMVRFKKYMGTPLVVSDGGKVKLIPSEEISPTTIYHSGMEENSDYQNTE